MTTKLKTFNPLSYHLFEFPFYLAANRTRSELTECKCKSTRKWKGKVVDETPLSDGYSQCRDMTDESASACSRYFDCFTNSVLEFNYFYSNLRTSGSIPSHLIPYLYVCDGIFDCANHSDETNCNYYWNINIMSLFCDSLFHSYFLLNTITFIVISQIWDRKFSLSPNSIFVCFWWYFWLCKP